ncbi:MAG TPA: GFA family protein [Polyangiaceae bacterium]
MNQTHTGSCHCGAVRFQVEVDLEKDGASKCNCSICQKLGAVGKVAKPSAFTLLAGEDAVGSYAWGAKISTRHLCKHCGVYVFGKGHLDVLGGDYVSFNVNCLDDVDPNALAIVHWDGRHDNWQAGPRTTPYPIVAASAVSA